jgi:hypothetical protein
MVAIRPLNTASCVLHRDERQVSAVRRGLATLWSDASPASDALPSEVCATSSRPAGVSRPRDQACPLGQLPLRRTLFLTLPSLLQLPLDAHHVPRFQGLGKRFAVCPAHLDGHEHRVRFLGHRALQHQCERDLRLAAWRIAELHTMLQRCARRARIYSHCLHGIHWYILGNEHFSSPSQG